MAGHGRGDAVEPRLQRVDRVVVGDLVGKVADQLTAHWSRRAWPASRAPRSRRGRTARCRGRSGASVSACTASRDGILLRQVDDLRQEQHLRRQRPRTHRLLQRLVDQPLMRGMLVDDDERIARSARRCSSRGSARAPHRAPPRATVSSTATEPARASPLSSGPASNAACAVSPKPLLQRPRRRACEIVAGRRGSGAERRVERAVAVGAARMRIGGRPGPERAHHLRSAGRCRADAGAGQRLADRADDQPAHQAGIAEAHIGLGRMHVDVDIAPDRASGTARSPHGGRAPARRRRRRGWRRRSACRAPAGR